MPMSPLARQPALLKRGQRLWSPGAPATKSTWPTFSENIRYLTALSRRLDNYGAGVVFTCCPFRTTRHFRPFPFSARQHVRGRTTHPSSIATGSIATGRRPLKSPALGCPLRATRHFRPPLFGTTGQPGALRLFGAGPEKNIWVGIGSACEGRAR